MERKLEEKMKEDQGGGCDDDDEDTDDDEGMNADEGGGHKDTDEDFSVEKKVSIARTSGPGQKCVPGIIYLGHIPPRLRPKHLRNMLSSYGEVGRVFLQPEGEGQVRRSCSPPGSKLRLFVLPRPAGEKEEEEVWAEEVRLH